MNLNIENWKEFFVYRNLKQKGLFDISQCKCGCAGDLEEGDEINYIGAKKNDNGIMKKVKRVPSLVSKGNCIVFICDGEGSVGYTNYEPCDFIGSTTLSVGYDDMLNPKIAIFLVTILDREKFKFSYGRKYRASLDSIKIKLPIKTNENGIPILSEQNKYSEEGYIPDFEFMEKYIESLNHKTITTKNRGGGYKSPTLGQSDYKEFRLGDLFEKIYKAEAHVKGEMETADYNTNGYLKFITRTEENNGCDCYVKSDDLTGVEEGNAIIIGDTTSTCFYQPTPFCSGDHIVVCRAKWINKYTALFIKTLLERERYRYSYGRAFKMELIKNTTVKLPVNNEMPDWALIEDYVKYLPYGDRI